MTDVSSQPFTGLPPAPMFATDPQPVANPSTEPHVAPIFDTGPHPDPLQPAIGPDTDPFGHPVTVDPGLGWPPAAPAAPVAVPGGYQFVRRWMFALILAGTSVLAGASGAGFYHWWYVALSKTLPVFGILLFLVACMLASLLVSMISDRPQLTALALALMAAPLAAMGAAAVLHGAYYFEWIARPAVG